MFLFSQILNIYFLRKKKYLFLIVTSNLCIQKNAVGISLVIEQIHQFVVWRIRKKKESQFENMTCNTSKIVGHH